MILQYLALLHRSCTLYIISLNKNFAFEFQPSMVIISGPGAIKIRRDHFVLYLIFLKGISEKVRQIISELV